MNIRDLIRIVEQVGDNRKINRTAFLYMDPKEPADEFAQCATCQHFMPGILRCTLFSDNDKVIANASCALYAHGKPNDDQEITNSVTPEHAGYVLGQVRCENCTWFKNDQCDLFKLLVEKMPDAFDLDPAVNAQGCCNGWQSKE